MRPFASALRIKCCPCIASRMSYWRGLRNGLAAGQRMDERVSAKLRSLSFNERASLVIIRHDVRCRLQALFQLDLDLPIPAS